MKERGNYSMLTFRRLTLNAILATLNDCLNKDIVVCQGTDRYIRRLVLDEYEDNYKHKCTHTTLPSDIKWVDGRLIMDEKKYSLMWEDEDYNYINWDEPRFNDYYLILGE